MANRIQYRRDTAANWTAANPILASGEKGLETDTKRQKMGDGTTAWTGLGYQFDKTTADATYTPMWLPSTVYVAGQQTVSPYGDTVTALTSHTSGTTFTPANWTGNTRSVLGFNNAQLTTWRAGLANREYAGTDIVIIGDSIGEGEGATVKTRRFADRVMNLLRAKYPVTGVVGGAGYLPCWSGVTTYTKAFTLSTGMTLANRFGFGKRGVQLATSPATITWSGITATSVKIAYFSDSGTGSFTWAVDGGSTTTVNTSGTHTGTKYATISGLGGTSHSIVVSGGSGYVEIQGILVYNGDEAAGIRVWESGHYGYMASDFISTPSGGTATDWLGPVTTVQPSAVVIELGENDVTSVSAATFKANLLTLIANVKGAVTIPPSIVLLGLFKRNGTLIESWDNYVAAMYSIAAADSTVSVCDLSQRMPQVNGDVLSLYADNLVHPTDKGHALIADALVSHLARAV